MITRFYTASGSAYELDEDAKRIRRVSGEAPGTSRQGPDGEWRSYHDVSRPVVGEPVVIAWDPATTPLLEGSVGGMPATITSPVVRTAVTV
jgi:hypothetical protein